MANQMDMLGLEALLRSAVIQAKASGVNVAQSSLTDLGYDPATGKIHAIPADINQRQMDYVTGVFNRAPSHRVFDAGPDVSKIDMSNAVAATRGFIGHVLKFMSNGRK